MKRLRVEKTFHIEHPSVFKTKLLIWAQQFKEVVYLDNNNHPDHYGRYEMLLAVDSNEKFDLIEEKNLKGLNDYHTKKNDWLFGFLTYDIKNDIEALESNNFDGLEFPKLYFFQPKKIIGIINNKLKFIYLSRFKKDIERDLKNIQSTDDTNLSIENEDQGIKIRLRVHKDNYISRVNKILEHIGRGDIYEVNYCQEFYAEDSKLDPLCTFNKLNKISESPFAAYLKIKDHYALCASPERYLRRDSNTIISQPIKGTAKRSNDKLEDITLKKQLKIDLKEISENIMIVDLVRNDLSHTALRGSVTVKELCEVYSYNQVHQMISTIASAIPDQTGLEDLIKTTFPMGSMTGAPKISAMNIIEKLESTKRGLYSGSIGYIEPNGDFDFNVVIRTILYNAKKQYVSYSVGSAITSKSSAIKEYEECLVKAKAMRDVLEGTSN